MVQALHVCRRRFNRESECALPAVARRVEIGHASRRGPCPYIGDGRVSPPEPPTHRHEYHGASCRDGVPAAVLDGRTGDRRLRREHVGRALAHATTVDEHRLLCHPAPLSRARAPHVSEGAADLRLEGRR